MVKLNETEKKQAKQEAKTEEKVEVTKTIKSNATLEDLAVVFYPLVTEKSVNMIEAENKLIFVVNKNATKPMVKEAVEKLYKVKVSKVNIIKDMKARKKAIVTISKEFKADDIATKLGVI